MKFLLFLVLVTLAVALPHADQLTLANSLVVGRQEDLQMWICHVCDETNKPIHSHYIKENNRDIKCILSVYPQFVILAFRYTNSLMNLWEDILYPFQVTDENTCKKCKVQKQYNKMWNSIRKNVTDDLLEIRSQTQISKLYITGISLGGGLAGISFVDLHYDQIFPQIRITTFGAPKIGNKHWAKHFNDLTNDSSRRFIVKGDPIVVLPKCLTPLCSYRHTGIKIVCKEKREICTQEQEIEDDEQWTDDVDPSMRNLNSLRDHIYGYKKIYNFSLLMQQ